MPRIPRPHWPTGPRTVFFDDAASAKTLARAAADARIRKLTIGVWTADMGTSPADIVATQLWEIVANRLPGSVIVDRTAAANGQIVDGAVTVATDARATNLELPGVTVIVRDLARDETDLPWSHGLTFSAPARTLVDNLAVSRARSVLPARTLTVAELQDWLSAKVLSWPDERFARLRDDAVAYAERTGVVHQIEAIDELFDEVTGRRPLRTHSGTFTRAVRDGDAWDERRVAAFENAARVLENPSATALAELALPAVNPDGELPFYEAYFSNFIEGTEFTVADAREIVETQTAPASRPEDGHDILGTHACIVDPIGRSRTSDDVDELVELLFARHRTILAGRPDKGPGQFKDRNNQVGGVAFVDHTVAPGTLRRGLALIGDLPPGFARAVYIMFVVAEVHPFIDGNGRAARLMMNAELSAVDQARIVVPTVLRNEYVTGLRRATVTGGNVDVAVTVLSHAWRWSAAMPWSDRAAVDGLMVATNALADSNTAEGARIRLELP